jgi:hypothetical protein
VRDRVAAMRDIGFDYYRLIQTVAAAINDRPGCYADTVATIAALAARHGIDLDSVAVPPPLAERNAPPSGATAIGADCVRFVIDGSVIPLANVEDAVRLMQQFVPSLAELSAAEIRKAPSGLMVRRGETLDFRRGGSGVPSLRDGWGEPEMWGTWSVAKQAEISFAFDPKDREPILAVLRYRAFLPRERPSIVIVCRHDGREVASWTCTDGSSGSVQHFTIPRSGSTADGVIELEYSISDPRAPAEFGSNSDQRLLGIGIESLKILA